MGCFWCLSIPCNPYTNISAKLKFRTIFLEFWTTLILHHHYKYWVLSGVTISKIYIQCHHCKYWVLLIITIANMGLHPLSLWYSLGSHSVSLLQISGYYIQYHHCHKDYFQYHCLKYCIEANITIPNIGFLRYHFSKF